MAEKERLKLAKRANRRQRQAEQRALTATAAAAQVQLGATQASEKRAATARRRKAAVSGGAWPTSVIDAAAYTLAGGLSLRCVRGVSIHRSMRGWGRPARCVRGCGGQAEKQDAARIARVAARSAAAGSRRVRVAEADAAAAATARARELARRHATQQRKHAAAAEEQELSRREAADVRLKWPLDESPWLQFTSECQRF
eukprot:COSAG01_NODE_6740_length_3521_cov_11.615722_2_plen_199_part_00